MPQTVLDMVPKAKLSSKKLLVLVLKVDEFNDNTVKHGRGHCAQCLGETARKALNARQPKESDEYGNAAN